MDGGEPVEYMQKQGVLDPRCCEGHSATVETSRDKPAPMCKGECIVWPKAFQHQGAAKKPQEKKMWQLQGVSRKNNALLSCCQESYISLSGLGWKACPTTPASTSPCTAGWEIPNSWQRHFCSCDGSGKATDPAGAHSEPLKRENCLPGQDALELVFAGSSPRSRAKFNKRHIINFRCTCQDVTDTVLERSSILFVSHNVAIILL